MLDLKIWDERSFNKTEHIYSFPNGSFIEFFSVDEESKVRGRKRQILFLNEANELTADDFLQLELRTIGKIFFDFNPSMSEDHWLFSDVLKRSDAILVKSDYTQNPFLPASLIRKIENLKASDSLWTIFGKGERYEIQEGTVFPREYYSEYLQAPDDLRVVIYTDPNLSLRGKGGTTSILKIGYSPSSEKYYALKVVVVSFKNSNHLLDSVIGMYEPTLYGVAFDGNYSQEATWTNLINNYFEIKKVPRIKIEFKRYKTDSLSKMAQFLWVQRKILFPVGFGNSLDGKAFLTQLFAFISKKENKTDDAPDSLICGIEYLNEKKLTKKRKKFRAVHVANPIEF